MGSYIGRYPKLYDFFYKDKPYADEANFIHKCLQGFKSGTMNYLLELGCGTGTHSFELEKKGYKIIATDYSKAMISVAKRKAARISSQINFVQQDMRSLNMPLGAFDAVISLFDSIGYVVANDDLMKTLGGIYEVLRADGLVILEFWHAPAMLKNYEPVRMRCMKIPGGAVLRISETKIDYYMQTGNVNYTVYELNDKNQSFIYKELHQTRYFFVQEMAAYLVFNGFTPIKFFPGFLDSGVLDENAWHIVALARRNKR